MNRRRLTLLSICLALASASFCPVTLGAGKAEQQAKVRKSSQQILARLYRIQPQAKQEIAKSAGYAVFDNFGMKILVAGGGTGAGLAVDNASKRETFMKMAEIQAGLGFGVKKFQLIWVFRDKKALDSFVNSGWELGAQANASAKYDTQGVAMAGALAVSPGIWLYQLSGDSLALELTAKGTKYYRDDELNSN